MSPARRTHSRLGRCTRTGLAAALTAALLAALLPASVLASAPDALDDAFVVGVDAPLTTLAVLANDTGDTLAITAVTDPAHGTAVVDGASIDYTPDAAFRGTDAFDYTVEDAVGATDTATVTVIVDDPPTAVDDPGSDCEPQPSQFGGGFPVPEDWRSPASPPVPSDFLVLFGACALLHNDTDPNGDPLTYEIASQPAHGTAVKVDEDFFAYKPDPDYGTQPGWLPGHAWQLDSFTYRAFDGLLYSAPATMSFWVAAVNDPPTFTPGAATVVVDEDSGAYSAPWATDVSPGPPDESDQAVAFEVTNLDVTGVPDLFSVDPAISPDGTLTFTPGPGQVGLAKVTVQAKDDGGLEDWNVQPGEMVPPDDTSDAVTFEIVVMPVLHAPVAGPDSVTVARDAGPTAVDVLANDTDADGDPLTISGATDGSHGAVAIGLDGTSLTYAPDAGYVGPDAFTYTVSDGTGRSAEGQVAVTVSVPNHAPSGADSTVTTDEDTDYAITAADLGFTDPDDSPPNVLAGVRIAGLPATGTLRDDGTPVEAGQLIPVEDIDAGRLVFSPAKDAFGPSYASFSFQVQDDGGTAIGGVDLDPTARVLTIDVAPVNDDPVAVPDSVVLDEDSPATAVDVLANDTDVDDAVLTVTGTTNGTKGTVAIIDGGARLTYTPDALATGSDTFTYQVSDGHGTSVTGTVSVTITPVNHAPNAANDVGLAVPESAGATTLEVLDNDTDLDGDPLTIVTASNGAHGSVSIIAGGTALAYTPVARYVGTDVFTYQVSDGHGGTDGATVLVNVVRDTTAPTVTAPAQRFPGQTVGVASERVRLSWSGSDAGSGIARYQLQVSVNGGRFTNVTLPHATTTTIDRTIANGATYRFRVRAFDREGNGSAYRYGPTFRAYITQESSSTVTYHGSWTLRSSRSMLGGHGRSTSSTTRRVSIRRTASDIAWVTTRTTASGRAEVWLDGVLAATVNLRSSSTRYRQLVYQHHFASVGTHTLEIRPIGGGRVDLDAVIVLR